MGDKGRIITAPMLCMKHQRKVEAKKKGHRPAEFTPEKAVVQQRIERKKKLKKEKEKVA